MNTNRSGTLPSGSRNTIADVAGVRIGHSTISNGEVQTGVTAIIPHEGNLFQEKLFAASHVINGFGKSVGLVQINELGQLETPIVLTNTFSVGLCSEALIEYMLADNADIGVSTGTVNPVVGECNDGYLNDIRGMHVKKKHVFEALRLAEVDFAQGAVGAGTGMSCYELKGGIGSASRLISLGEKEYVVGTLVVSNFGRLPDLVINHDPIGRRLQAASSWKDEGSIIVVIATDIPLDARQLKRVAKRASVGISRTGSYIGNGSGEIAMAFSTAQRINHYQEHATSAFELLHEDKLDAVFEACVEAVEDAVLQSLFHAETVVGRAGHERKSLHDMMNGSESGNNNE